MYNKNILIADDSESFLRLYKNIFKWKEQNEGYNIKTFLDGTYILEYIKNEYEKGKKIPLCILDVMMPIMDGITTAGKIREIDSEIIIIIITSNEEITLDEIRDNLKKDIYYFRKPFKKEELYCLVDSLIKVWNQHFQLKIYQTRLEKIVKERTAELIETNRRLTEEVHERKRAQEEITLLAEAIKQTGDSIVITDNNGKIQYVNTAFERISGYKLEEVKGKNPRFLKSGKHKDDYYRELWDTISSGNIWKGGMTNRKKDGSFYNLEVSITPIKDNKGKIINYVSVRKDITEKIKMEKQLYQSQKMEALGTLAGGIAHDFNNILTGIIGYTELAIVDIPRKSHINNILEDVIKAGHRAKDLVKQILYFSKRSQEEPKPVEINNIVHEAVNLLKASIPKTIEVRDDIIPEKCIVLADPTQIHQIIMNLGTNAFHAMKNGGIMEISLNDVFIGETSKDIKPGNYVKLTIRDTGCGMDKTTLEHIFEPYFTTKPPDEGTGLGLSVVHGIVKKYGGEISVFSNPGSGSVFNIYFPKIDKDSEILQVSSFPERLTGKERILIIDDEEDVVNIMNYTLKHLGYEVIARENPIEALNLFRTSPDKFDLVITDHHMPHISGIDLASEIIKIRPGLPVVLCTGFSNDKILNKAKEIGIRYCINKPVSIKTIAETIKKIMKGELAL